jgi:hypothetical protein
MYNDQTYFYWIWLLGTASDKSIKGVPVYLDKFTFDVSITVVLVSVDIDFFGKRTSVV